MSNNPLGQLVATEPSASLTARYGQVMMNTFGPPKRVFVRGEGCHIFDADGVRYLDLLSGLAVNALGHAHPFVLSAITSQIATLGHVSNFFSTPAQVALAERLAAMVVASAPDTPARVFFSNSGTEANEAAFKLTRRTGRTRIISTEGAFHGRTMGALAITHNEKYRTPFEPLPGDVTFVPYGDVAALEAAVDDTVAAVVLEPIQGENGVIVPPEGYLAAARQITRRHGSLLWLDEVQTGIGRSGAWLDHTREQITADIVTIAKGLGNGFPIGACIATGAAADLLGPGSHGSTFGGNPVAAIAGLAVLSVIERDNLLANANAMGDHLAGRVSSLESPMITGVRGRGLLRAIVLAAPIAARVADVALDAGFIINAPRPDVLRLAPPLIITAEQLDSFVAVLPELISSVSVDGAVR
ncbi:acetylornithine transaminase [Microlunatus panaciterrae]|uniref:Acetylornithine aminotransferase n=1 Tax=Microlunatus panaciterrae TaxID=400768 RepID=A0ABS2RN71_9ACTN|nr:acetylornithine transaminase [Microlunatus panaciterrae]MBM7800451.1 acetylornithine aminotransferase [Microlunatus panaciterrae]